MEDKEIIKQLLWMARRYCDGRMTYAPSLFNRIQKAAVNKYGIEIIGDKPGTTENFPYALDGDPTIDAIGNKILPGFPRARKKNKE